VKVYTAYVRPERPATLVAEGFAWGAFAFGPLWLFWQKAWISGLLLLVAEIAASFAPGQTAGILDLALALLAGLFGRDGVRWDLMQRGWHFAAVVAGRDEDSAFVRLLGERPELASTAAGRV